MKPFQTILFAADFSEISKNAFRLACSLAIEGTTRFIVVHVIEPNWVPEEPGFLGQSSIRFREAEQEPGRVEAIRRKLIEIYAPNRPIEMEYLVKEGEVAAEIVGLAKDCGADLIVTGTHGRRGLSRLLAGSVATEVLHKAQCSVLAMRGAAPTREADEIKVILHPTDFSYSSEGAQVVARSLACELGARLVLLHVAEVPPVLDGAMLMEVDLRCFSDSLEKLRKHLDGPDLKYPGETRLTSGNAQFEILQVAAELNADLIVMGTHGRTGLSRLLMGSVAEYVLPRANCPVMVIKDPSRMLEMTSEQPVESAPVSGH
jgi:nucleotide-binding universal stress UspA family protein